MKKFHSLRIFVKASLFLFIAAFGFAGTSVSARTLHEYRQKLLEDHAFFDADRFTRRQGSAQSLVDSKNQASEAAPAIQEACVSQASALIQQAAPSVEADRISQWFSQSQQVSPSGLIASHPDDPGFIFHEGRQDEEWAKILATTQAYTYDQALAGIVLLDHGDAEGAKKILDFYTSQREAEGEDFSGFWTVYNVDPAFDWKKYEWRKGFGENAWVALFALKYASSQQDPAEKQKALDLATGILRWIGKLPHHGGAVAMGVPNPGATPDFGTIYSVENNLDYYALLKTMKTQAASQEDRDFFAAEFDALQGWLKNEAFDASTGLFKRGGAYNSGPGVFVWDGIQSLDVQSWAIAALGVKTLVTDFGIDMDDFVSKIHQTFAVQNDGSFGGDILQAKGFDFSDALNAAALARPGFNWVEGTNQMVLAYKMLADFYKGDAAKAASYQALADHFLSRNAENAIESGGALSYAYADLSDVQIFVGTSVWRTTPGQAAPSTAWVYLAEQGINPFVSFPEEEEEVPAPGQAFSASASTTSSPGLKDLFIDVDENNQASVRFGQRTVNGIFDAATKAIHVQPAPDSAGALSESWDFYFETRLVGADISYSLAGLKTSLLHVDGWQYDHTYSFTDEGLLGADNFLQQSDEHTVSELIEYEYTTTGGQHSLESSRSTKFFDGVYGYGTETRYAYEVNLSRERLTRVSITQETRNVPGHRLRASYQLVFHDNGLVEYLDLGIQEILF